MNMHSFREVSSFLYLMVSESLCRVRLTTGMFLLVTAKYEGQLAGRCVPGTNRWHSSQGQHQKDGLSMLCLAILFQPFTANLVCNSPRQWKAFSESTHRPIHAATPTSEKHDANRLI